MFSHNLCSSNGILTSFFFFLESKAQVTANLANFAYDPINYQHFKKSAVPDLFLQLLSEIDTKLVLHGISGICNCCLGKIYVGVSDI